MTYAMRGGIFFHLTGQGNPNLWGMKRASITICKAMPLALLAGLFHRIDQARQMPLLVGRACRTGANIACLNQRMPDRGPCDDFVRLTESVWMK